MTRRQMLRRVGILCCHFIRNLAFFKAGWRKGKPTFQGQFWTTANGNFLDICVLEWCKLFGDKRGEHYWRKVITDQPAFFGGLLKTISLTEPDFNAYIEEMKTYRDKFVAHLDADEIMRIPNLRVAGKSVLYLYDYLFANEEEDDCFHDAPPKMSRFYDRFMRHGRQAYLR